jgi:murein DD-endopeptidase MepM/ murein hydrolase activator NlpD
LERLAKTEGSPDAAVLSLFAGETASRFAVERTLARKAPLDIGKLSDNLPPGFDDAASQAQDVLAFATAYGLGWPLYGRVALSSGFGMRRHPVLGGNRMHSGLDLPVPPGTAVHAVADGTVRRASEDAVNGRMLIVDHGHGVTTAYLHNSQLLVSEGTVVKRGEVIARSGSTGRATGPHLHYQLELFGKAVDPLAFRPERLPVATQDGP